MALNTERLDAILTSPAAVAWSAVVTETLVTFWVVTLPVAPAVTAQNCADGFAEIVTSKRRR